jgi:hypothetical protein
MKSYLFLFATVFLVFQTTAHADEVVAKQTQILLLGETAVKINIYERNGSGVTFFAPHHNEQTALRLAKDSIRQKGGRLIEIESFEQNGNPARRLVFVFDGKSFSVDPNRIFTANGRRCGGFAGKVEAAINNFADELLKIIYQTNENISPNDGKLVVAVHNNHDVDDKSVIGQASDLTATAFVKSVQFRPAWRGAFEAQAAGVYLSNDEHDADNFIFLSTPRFVSYFAENNFNVVVQKPFSQLFTDRCGVDDGSLSVYAAQQNIEYVCLEADQANGGERQKQMFESVYRLLLQSAENARAVQADSKF